MTGSVIAGRGESGAIVWGPETLGYGLLHAYDSGRLFGLTSAGVLIAIDAATGHVPERMRF